MLYQVCSQIRIKIDKKDTFLKDPSEKCKRRIIENSHVELVCREVEPVFLAEARQLAFDLCGNGELVILRIFDMDAYVYVSIGFLLWKRAIGIGENNFWLLRESTCYLSKKLVLLSFHPN